MVIPLQEWTKDGIPFISGTWMLDQDMTLVAVWTEWPVITLDLQGGTGTTIISKAPETEITAPDVNPTKLGYAFDYYYETADNVPYVFTTMPVTDLSLYARWTPINYSMTYNFLEGTSNEDNPTSYTIESTSFNLVNPDTRAGYTFVGWFNAAEEGDLVSTITQGSTGHKIVFARWEAKGYTITYNSMGGVVLSNLSVTYDAAYTLGITTKSGYLFSGWT